MKAKIQSLFSLIKKITKFFTPEVEKEKEITTTKETTGYSKVFNLIDEDE